MNPPGYNYLGPFNRMDKGPPTNSVDEIAYRHDVKYGKYKEKYGWQPYYKFNKGDRKYIDDFYNLPKSEQTFWGNVGAYVFRAKELIAPRMAEEKDFYDVKYGGYDPNYRIPKQKPLGKRVYVVDGPQKVRRTGSIPLPSNRIPPPWRQSLSGRIAPMAVRNQMRPYLAQQYGQRRNMPVRRRSFRRSRGRKRVRFSRSRRTRRPRFSRKRRIVKRFRRGARRVFGKSRMMKAIQNYVHPPMNWNLQWVLREQGVQNKVFYWDPQYTTSSNGTAFFRRCLGSSELFKAALTQFGYSTTNRYNIVHETMSYKVMNNQNSKLICTPYIFSLKGAVPFRASTTPNLSTNGVYPLAELNAAYGNNTAFFPANATTDMLTETTIHDDQPDSQMAQVGVAYIGPPRTNLLSYSVIKKSLGIRWKIRKLKPVNIRPGKAMNITLRNKRNKYFDPFVQAQILADAVTYNLGTAGVQADEVMQPLRTKLLILRFSSDPLPIQDAAKSAEVAYPTMDITCAMKYQLKIQVTNSATGHYYSVDVARFGTGDMMEPGDIAQQAVESAP